MLLMTVADEKNEGMQRNGYAEVKGRRSGEPKRGGKRKEVMPSYCRVPELEEYLKNRDFSGALTLCEFNMKSDEVVDMEDTLMWIGYCAFHKGAYQRSISAYKQLLDIQSEKASQRRGEMYCLLACCYYYMHQYKETASAVEKAPDCDIKNRIRLHIAKKIGEHDEDTFTMYKHSLSDSREDRLSLAAVHYLSGHYQEALDIYKQLLEDNHDDIALNVYMAMCYYKLEYYDVSLEVLSIYLQVVPDSFSAINLKACNLFRLYNGRAAMKMIKSIKSKGYELEGSNGIIQHNIEVFNEYHGRLKSLLPLVNFVPEARLNVAVYYIRNNAIQEAHELIETLEPQTTHEYILKGVVSACLGQQTGNLEHLTTAQQYFQFVGASPSQCDTILGRQCMASCFYLLKQFEDVIIYLNSIKAYMHKDDAFNWNYGMSLAEMGHFKDAEEILLEIQIEEWKTEYVYISWLAHCNIMNGNPESVWELYLKMETSEESFNVLHLIANDCYRMGHFLFSAKAFDDLHRLDPDPEYWKGLCGACIGVFQLVLVGKATEEELQDVISMLRNENIPQVEHIVNTMIQGLEFTITKN